MISIVGWRGPDDPPFPKLPPPPPPPPSDLGDMRSALAFAVKLLRSETGPGGLVEREPDAVRATWELAIDCLESAGTVPMIPLYEWRRRDCPHGEDRDGTHTLARCREMRERATMPVQLFALLPASAVDCGSCEGLDGTHTVRGCVGAR